ncbi:MAG: type II toxin-antitoxin system Phd/YefM family antitoxin [Proteobacteria bacterium]|nr:type II toxin-antitoxin system Phd/YefM family antitoxin [Pseudomonadota bacterium]NOG59432.1 type II toxin-antitoxin system Phd/YefM family antitoxin [Pseudomonadota bacterium]
MNKVGFNEFKGNFKNYINQVVNQHLPIKVTCRNGNDFVVINANDWEREQETLYVLQNTDLMDQIANSLKSHSKRKVCPNLP